MDKQERIKFLKQRIKYFKKKQRLTGISYKESIKRAKAGIKRVKQDKN